MKFADINSLAVIAYTVLMIGFVVLIIAGLIVSYIIARPKIKELALRKKVKIKPSEEGIIVR